MDYQKAKELRKKNLSDLMTQKLVEGEGVFSSLGKSISEKTKARMTGIKQSFDPLQIAKTLTFGSNLAPVLLGKMLGRSKDDLQYFTGRAGLGRKPGVEKLSSDSNEMAVEVLGLIYRCLLRAEEQDKLLKEQENSFEEEKNSEEEKRNQELIKALSVRRKPKKSAKKPTKEVPPTEKKVPTEKPEVKPKAQSVTKTEVKQTPTAKPVSTSTTKPPTAGKIPSGASIIGGLVTGAGLASLSSSLIAKEEGLPKNGKAYWDPPGQQNLVSVGYGHQIKPEEYKQGFIQAGDEKVPIVGQRGIDTVMTANQSQKLLQLDLPKYESRAKEPLGDSWNKLNDIQKATLTSYAYNVGSTSNLVKAGLKQAIDSNNMQEASRIISEKGIKTSGGKYNKALDERRQKEAALFLSGENSKPTPETTSNVGNRIDSSSKENSDLKKELNDKKPTQNITNNNVSSISNNNTTNNEERVDDRPILLKKKG